MSDCVNSLMSHGDVERPQVCDAQRPTAAVHTADDIMCGLHLHHHRIQVLPRVLRRRRHRQV